MFYMIINGFNTSTIPHCVVTDFGQVEAAKPRVVEDANLYGANGSYRVLDGGYESYERTFRSIFLSYWMFLLSWRNFSLRTMC